MKYYYCSYCGGVWASGDLYFSDGVCLNYDDPSLDDPCKNEDELEEITFEKYIDLIDKMLSDYGVSVMSIITIRDNDEVLPLEIPRDIAVCPKCDANLILVDCTGWVDDDDGYQIPDEITVECENQPDDYGDDDYEADQWFDWHYDMPYVYWLPVEVRVLNWFKNKYRYNFGEELNVSNQK